MAIANQHKMFESQMFEEVVKFYVPTCLVLAGALSYNYITAGVKYLIY